MAPPLDFKALFARENDLLSQADQNGGKEKPNVFDTETPGPAGEPWIRYTLIDRVGLAFSGGGIRSATFNLGVLKALHELDLLKHVHYLSTVSGGGYIGAWWSAWRARCGKPFPETQVTSQLGTSVIQTDMNREPEEVRHLREFSNFLSPRIGFFESEMWNAIMAVLSAVLPAILVATSVIALALLVWLGVNSVFLADALGIPLPFPRLGWLKVPVVLSAVTIIVYAVLEYSWWRDQKAERLRTKKWLTIFWVFHVLMPGLLIFGICFGWHFLAQAGWMKADPPSDVSVWKWGMGIAPDGWGFSFSPHLFAAPILWVGVALSLLVPRLLLMRILKVSVSTRLVSAVDRALSRILGSAVVVAALGALWLAGCWLNYTHWGTKMPAGGALLSGGAFALLRNWIGQLGPAKKGGVMDIVKPLIPQILAYFAIALWAVCIAALLAGWIRDGFSAWKLFAIALGIVVFAVFFFDPAQVSMHSFYRNRLARAYLGASNNDAEQSSEKNRQTDVRAHDDIELWRLSPTGRERPIHLVCCAANDLGGDQLGNLARGARSAVLSKIGFAIGDYCHTWDGEAGKNRETLGLASAITASAAAFNSNMGSLSMTLGAGVTFLCSALNLRLGLWLPHPLNETDGAPKLMPGMLFLKEMFGLTNSGLRVPAAGHTKAVAVAKYVHLSDGGHFENLALYELVRRHCRYIIVSDCGADPEVAFDDFGNALRRIREDFGVDIEIDLSPLKPDAARLSKQHVAVGTISYNSRGDKDIGILLYFKPTLTGDEPCDIAQYKARNEDFPHETTGDQFYDEAQWESYRRLGEHAARAALHFVERRGANPSPDAVFNDARWEWYQSPARLDESIVELTGRLTALEQQLRQEAPLALVREMYPELQTMDQEKGPVPPMMADEMRKTLHFLVQIIQLMEDVWLNCYLETHWNHPNNLGWMNTFQRWAYTPSFRLWWPLLKSMYGSKFRRFMEERLNLADEDYPPTMAKVNKHETKRPEDELPDGLAQIYWKRMNEGDQKRGLDKTIFSYDLDLVLQRQDGKDDHRHVQAGLAFLDLQDKPTACWTAEEFFVPPGLWGAGLGGRFLYDLLKELAKNGFRRCEVTVEPPNRTAAVTVELPKRTDLASRQQRNDLLAFYQRAGFELDDARNCLVRRLEDMKQEMSPP